MLACGRTVTDRIFVPSKRKDRTSEEARSLLCFNQGASEQGTLATKLLSSEANLGLLLFGRGRRRRNVAGRSWRGNFATAARSNVDFAAAARSWGWAASRSFAAAGVDFTAATMLAAEQTTATTMATAFAAVATASATAFATAATTMLTTAASNCTAVATAIATAAAAIAATATMTEQASAGRFFTAHQGDTDDREENRDATNNKTIHPRTSKKTYWYRKRTKYHAVLTPHPRCDGRTIGSVNANALATVIPCRSS